ncbi:MAG: pentapeptide repeat-containing protein, partial [Byssovorax sp.]
ASLAASNSSRASFAEANLTDAMMRSGLFAGADFSGANLRGAKVGFASFEGAILNGADMRCHGLADAALTGAIADSKTLWPEGFDPMKYGVIVDWS